MRLNSKSFALASIAVLTGAVLCCLFGFDAGSSTIPIMLPRTTRLGNAARANPLIIPGVPFRTNLFVLPKQRRLAFAVPPVPKGVYQSEPYKSIVVVPGPHPDDKFIHPAAPVDTNMSRKPELHLIPRSKP